MSGHAIAHGAHLPPRPLDRGPGFRMSPATTPGGESPGQTHSPALGRAVAVGSGASSRPVAADHQATWGRIKSGAGTLLNIPRAIVGVGLALGLTGVAVGVGVAAAVAGAAGYLVAAPVLALARWATSKSSNESQEAAAPQAAAHPGAAPTQGKPELRVEREVAAEVRFKAVNVDMVNALAIPPAVSRLGSAADQERVVAKLLAHGKGNVSEAEVREWLVAGENIARALQAQQPGDKPVVKNAVNADVEIQPCVYTVRALAWYVAAQTARQDVAREALGVEGGVTDLAKSGASVMKDPGNKIYDFLHSAPSCAPRMSTHFADRQDGGRMHWIGGLIPTFTKKEQHGIEDYCSKMPGPGGTLLFEKLRPSGDSPDPELFIKFESAGCPPYFGASEAHHTRGDRLLQIWHAGKRNLRHTFNFHASTKAAPAATDKPKESARQEHVHKGFLEDVSQDYRAVIATAGAVGLLPMKGDGIRYTRDELISGMKKRGLPFVKEMVEKMAYESSSMSNVRSELAPLVLQVAALETKIADKEAALNAVSHIHGIERRGAETHLNLSYDWNHPE